MQPDVIVSVTDGVAVFEAQNSKAAECLGELCEAPLHNVHEKIVLESYQKRSLVNRLTKAGFWVLE